MTASTRAPGAGRRQGVSRTALAARGLWCAGGLAVLALVGCAPVSDPSAGLTPAQAVELIDRTPRADLDPETVAAAFALNSKSTDVQRQMLEQSLVGHTIEWTIPVYDVQLDGARFLVQSSEFPLADSEALPLLRVMAYLTPQNEADDATLRAVKTGDTIRIRGIVQEIRLRTFVVVVPGVVVGGVEVDASAGS